MSGDVGENRDRLLSFMEKQGIELVFTENIRPALGRSYGGRIAILPGQSKAEEFSVLVHEVAHELLHKAERRTATTKVTTRGERHVHTVTPEGLQYLYKNHQRDLLRRGIRNLSLFEAEPRPRRTLLGKLHRPKWVRRSLPRRKSR